MTASRHQFSRVVVTGGAGYVGSALVPTLLQQGYHVTVLDLFIFGDDVFPGFEDHPNLVRVKGDLRERSVVERAVSGADAVIHLACISNDPSFELNPDLGKSINYDAFFDLVSLSKAAGVRRFIYASSSSVYGIKAEPNVTEDLPLEPLTDYSKYKALCEEVLLKEATESFVPFIVRPATICGYAPRLRLDLTVNILTTQAVQNGKITVFGGDQLRPNLHIRDMVRFYEAALEWEDEQVAKKTYNVGYDNFKVSEIAEMVRSVVGPHVEIVRLSNADNRSYHISSEKIRRELGFTPQFTVKDAIQDLVDAFRENKLLAPIEDRRYYNIKTMQHVEMR